MSATTIRQAFIVFHVTLAAVVFIESALTVFHSLHSLTQSHLGAILPWFASVEALAAVLFLIPRTMLVGGVSLLLIFIIAIVIHGPAEQLYLFAYAAGIIFIMAHGTAYSAGAVRSRNRNFPEDQDHDN